MIKDFFYKYLLYLLVGFLASGYAVPAEAVRTWGASAMGMGQAYVASGGGLDGISFNPANAGSIKRGEFVSSLSRNNRQSVDILFGSVGSGVHKGGFAHSFALSRTTVSSDFSNFEVTSGLELDYTEDVYYYNLATGSRTTGQFAANVKYFSIRSSLDNVSASGYGLDLGYLLGLTKRLSFGASANNLSTSLDWETGITEDRPREFRGGFNYLYGDGLRLASDLVHEEDRNLKSLHVGLEKWWIFKRDKFDETIHVAARIGGENRFVGNEDTNLSLGFTILRGNGEITYAYQQRSNFDNRHIFGYNTKFGVGSF